jgi:hypothetical protein
MLKDKWNNVNLVKDSYAMAANRKNNNAISVIFLSICKGFGLSI